MKRIILAILLGSILIFFFTLPSFAGITDREPYVDRTFNLVLDQDLVKSTQVQYSSVVSSVTANSSVVVFSTTLGSKEKGQIEEVYVQLAFAIKAQTTASADISVKIQAKNSDYDTWQDLCDWITYSDVGTSYDEKQIDGYAKITADKFDRIPFDFRVLMKCDINNEGRIKIKGKRYSYVRVIYYRAYR